MNSGWPSDGIKSVWNQAQRNNAGMWRDFWRSEVATLCITWSCDAHWPKNQKSFSCTPVIIRVAAKQWIHFSEHHKYPEITFYVIRIGSTTSNKIWKVQKSHIIKLPYATRVWRANRQSAPWKCTTKLSHVHIYTTARKLLHCRVCLDLKLGYWPWCESKPGD